MQSGVVCVDRRGLALVPGKRAFTSFGHSIDRHVGGEDTNLVLLRMVRKAQANIQDPKRSCIANGS